MHDKLLIILSKESIASDWVQTEIRRARKQEKQSGERKLFPIRLCDMETALEVGQLEVLEKEFEKLRRDLRQEGVTASHP